MSDSSISWELRVGGSAAIVGGVGTLVGNILHPRPPAEIAPLLLVVAEVPHWTAIHLGIALSAVFIVGGLALLARTLEGALARALGVLATYSGVLGGSALIAGILIDGYGYPFYARQWVGASGEARTAIFAAADAVHTVDAALFVAWVTIFLGTTFTLAGAAVMASRNHSRLLGALGVLGGAMSLLHASSVALAFTSPLPVWPAAPALVSIWLLAVGIAMLRRARRT